MYSYRLPALSALRVALLVGISAMLFVVFTQSAHAANTVSSAVYLDTNGNGTVDTVRWTMDENVTACAYEAGDWTVNTASQMNLVITGISCTGSNAILNIAVTADANETGAATAPVISYANAGTAGSVTLTSGAMTAKNSQSTTDAANPVVVSVTPSNGSSGAVLSTNIVITFSEAMDTTFAEATEYAITPDPGSFAAAAWSAGNTVVTLDSSNSLSCGLSYAFTTAEGAIDAASGSPTALVTTGPVTGDSTFRTVACGVASSSVPVSVTDFSYAGVVCSADNTHSFSITGTNIDAYLVADNAYFTDSDWISNDIEGSETIEATFDDDTTWAYLALRSDTGAVSNVYSFELDDWNATCGSSDDTSDDEDMPTDDENDDEDTGSVTPVAGVSPGDVIHSSSSTAVYYVTETYGRRVFIDEQTYFTWYDSFDNVKEVSADTMSALPLEGNMLPKAGVVLVKIQSVADVFYLDMSNEAYVPELRLIRDEETAANLFGSYWADYVIDIEPTFFTKFNTGLDVEMDENLSSDLSDMKRREDLHD